MINIVCLKWGVKYGPEYVNRLYYAVRRHLILPYKFHCFTENASSLDANIIIHPLKDVRLDGWWNKLYLFSKEINIDGRILYIDLDTLITGNLNDIVSVNVDFVVLRDFYTGIVASLQGLDNVGSGLMMWNAKQHSYIWTEFLKNPEEIIKSIAPHGDQKWIQKIQNSRQYWQDVVPDQVVSFKVHCRDGLSSNARIVCYHGRPSIPESINMFTKDWKWNIPPQPWVAEHWKDE